MKKVATILCISIFLIFGCSESEDSYSENSASINPPEWIKGVWLADTWIDAGYKFTSDNFCIISLCDEACKIEEIENMSVSYEEVISDTYYSIAITYSNDLTGGATRNEYKFERVSDNQMRRIGESGIYTREQNDWVNCTSFDENSIYPLNGDDAWLVISASNAPALARVTLEIHFEDGTVEKNESNPNAYLSYAIRIDKEATKAILTVEDLDNLSGINYTVIGRLYNSDYSDQYFVLYEEDIRWINKTILFE